MLRSLRALAWAVGFSLSLITVQANDRPTFVAGDLIVKFTAASESGTLVTRVMQGDQTADRQLAALAARLSQELGVTVAAVRVTSGNELVLSVDRDRLAQSLKQVVTRDPAVRAATRIDPPKTVLPAAQLALALDLRRDSEAGRLVRRTARAGQQTSNEIEALVKKLCAGAVPQPSGRVGNRNQLVLTIDIAALTLDLVERLKRRPDVEYAQPSQIVKPYPGARP
jgi:carboxylesterase type B